jgi:hypothetical protein
MDQKIASLRHVLQAYVDSGFLTIFRYMDGHGGGKEEITFLRHGGEPIARVFTYYLHDIVKLQNTRPLENDYVLTNLVLEFVPPLPDNETKVENFIGMQNVVVPDIRIHRLSIQERDLFPSQRSLPSVSLDGTVHAYQMTPEYLGAKEAKQ